MNGIRFNLIVIMSRRGSGVGLDRQPEAGAAVRESLRACARCPIFLVAYKWAVGDILTRPTTHGRVDMVRYVAAMGLALGIVALGCSEDVPASKTSAEQAESSITAHLPIEQVMTEYTDSLMSFPGVVGVGVGEQDGKPCIAVLVVERSPDLEAQVPKRLGGYPVRIDETGDFRSDDDSIPPGD